MYENKTPEPEHPFCFIQNPQKRGHFLVGFWDKNDAFKVLHHAATLLSVEALIEQLIMENVAYSKWETEQEFPEERAAIQHSNP